MTYEWDDQACKEAVEHPIKGADADILRGECSRKAAGLGPDGVRSHTVRFPVTAWDEPPGLPHGVPRTGRISRGDVLDIGQQVRSRTRPATDLLAASYIWGWGTAGYGPRRLRDICAAAGDRLEPSLQSALDAAGKDPASLDPIAGYACLYGGYDYQDRAAPGQPPWSRLHGFGPAFFTKFLYFSTPGTLILDKRLASAVRRLSQLPNLATEDGRSLTWTPYRYAVYMHWMTQTAQTVGVAPDLLELTLFQPPGSLNEKTTRQLTDGR